MPLTTFGVGAAVTPTVIKTAISHYTDRKPRRRKPTAHISYDQGLNLVRSFLLYASHHTVEDLQAFTSQWVPHPTWTLVENVLIPPDHIAQAAQVLIKQLGLVGIEQVGGTKWWQWRRRDVPLKGEWVEMRADHNARQQTREKSRRIMLYVHGGAYFFGSVDEHRYQLQRHARKLQARLFAPRYRLAPQFPFPCGLHDCLAAYLYLLTIHDPTEIVMAGDSAGAGMVLSMLCMLRDQDLPMPAGAVLISPWVDLTHSFPSLSRTDNLDYIPAHGFMQRPSRSWPPPNEDELNEILQSFKIPDMHETVQAPSQQLRRMNTDALQTLTSSLARPLKLNVDGRDITVKDQVQLYTTNALITHPLVSPILQPSLGGLCPMLVMVGGGEVLRDEQIYLAHKAADPQAYPLPSHYRSSYDPDDKILNTYKPTPVQLQVWQDLCHVTPTLSFTRPAKFMYRSVAQFGAWALARAQKRAIIINQDMTDSSSETSDSEDEERKTKASSLAINKKQPDLMTDQVGKAGDPLPHFKNNMIRQLVDRHGDITSLAPPEQLEALQMSTEQIGVVKQGPIKSWLAAKKDWDTRYASHRRKVHRWRVESHQSSLDKELAWDRQENPPPTALIRRKHDRDVMKEKSRVKKNFGLGMWSSWGSKHDERKIAEDAKIEKETEKETETVGPSDGHIGTTEPQGTSVSSSTRPTLLSVSDRPRSRRGTVSVQDQGQIEGEEIVVLLRQTEDTGASATSKTVTTDGELEGTHSSPIHLTPGPYIPRWKNATHLHADSNVASDATSTYSTVVPDNASTTAVFSAPGVVKVEVESAESSSLSGNSNLKESASSQQPLNGFRKELLNDNLGGYDTPTSRRSVERLKSHQPGASLDSTGGSTVHEPYTDVSSEHMHTRPEAPRSSSAQAIVEYPGIVNEIEQPTLIDENDKPSPVRSEGTESHRINGKRFLLPPDVSADDNGHDYHSTNGTNSAEYTNAAGHNNQESKATNGNPNLSQPSTMEPMSTTTKPATAPPVNEGLVDLSELPAGSTRSRPSLERGSSEILRSAYISGSMRGRSGYGVPQVADFDHSHDEQRSEAGERMGQVTGRASTGSDQHRPGLYDRQETTFKTAYERLYDHEYS